MEKVFEKSMVVSARVDMRAMATLVKGWRKKFVEPPSSMGTLVRRTLEMVSGMMAEDDPTLRVESMEEAYETIRRAKVMPLGERNARLVTRALSFESLASEASGNGGQVEDGREQILRAAADRMRRDGIGEEEIRRRTEEARTSWDELEERRQEEEQLQRQKLIDEQIAHGKRWLEEQRQAQPTADESGSESESEMPSGMTMRERIKWKKARGLALTTSEYAEKERMKREELKAGMIPTAGVRS